MFKRAADKRSEKIALRIEAGLPAVDGKNVRSLHDCGWCVCVCVCVCGLANDMTHLQVDVSRDWLTLVQMRSIPLITRTHDFRLGPSRS